MTIEDMVGLTMHDVSTRYNNHELIFTATNGLEFRFYHDQDCCEHVEIVDICGELGDLIGSPITQAEEVGSPPYDADSTHDSGTWTFYKFATIHGSVTVRWLGTSNGYYSERVDLKISQA
jgi:hypothetical protein